MLLMIVGLIGTDHHRAVGFGSLTRHAVAPLAKAGARVSALLCTNVVHSIDTHVLSTALWATGGTLERSMFEAEEAFDRTARCFDRLSDRPL